MKTKGTICLFSTQFFPHLGGVERYVYNMAKELIPVAIDVISSIDDFTEENIYNAFSAKSEEMGIKKGQILFILRAAVTGVQSTPGGAVEMCDILGKEESLRRLNIALSLL